MNYDRLTSSVLTRSSSLSMRTRTSMAVPASGTSSAPQLFLQPARNVVGYVIFDAASESGELLDSAGAQETVLLARHEVDRLHVRGLVPVELVHLEFVLEVRDSAQPLDDRAGADPPREVDHEDVERLDADVVQIGGRGLDEAHSFLGGEQGLALAHGQIDDRDDDLVIQRRRPPDDVQVAVGDGVVGPRAYRDHAVGRHRGEDSDRWMR